MSYMVITHVFLQDEWTRVGPETACPERRRHTRRTA